MEDKKDFTHDDILDAAHLGNEPSEEYLERVKAIDNIVRDCMHVSKSFAGIRAPTGKHFYASVLFTSLITKSVSLLNIIPHSPWADKLIEHWDYSSAAVVVRTMLEVRLAFHYLCVEVCDKAEWECRWNVFNLHDCTARIRLLSAFGQRDEEVRKFSEQSDELRDRLTSNAYFLSLDNGLKKRLLNGQVAYIFPLEEIAERAGIQREQFRWMYIFLSSHVHSLPMSFYRMGGSAGDDRGRGLPDPVEENYTSLCVSLAATLLVKSRDEMKELFSDVDRAEKAEAQEGNLDEEQVISAAPQEIPLSLGQPKELMTSDVIRIKVTRASEDMYEFTYFYVPTDEIVLKRTLSEKSGSALVWFDRSFWSFSMDGHPATDRMLDAVQDVRKAFKIDHANLTIDIKIS